MRTMAEVTEALRAVRFMPVVTIEDPDDAVPLGQTLLRAGLSLVEVTFRTKEAQRAIMRLRAELPELLVAAGTVIDPPIVEKAIDAGAAFVVSPGLNPTIVDYCLSRRIPLVPGANAPTEIEIGRERGITTFGFFPAEASGGVPLLKALTRPFVGIEYLCSGGVTLDNLASYLAIDQVVACAGSWVATPEAISEHRFEEIEANARATVALIHSLADPGDAAIAGTRR